MHWICAAEWGTGSHRIVGRGRSIGYTCRGRPTGSDQPAHAGTQRPGSAFCAFLRTFERVSPEDAGFCPFLRTFRPNTDKYLRRNAQKRAPWKTTAVIVRRNAQNGPSTHPTGRLILPRVRDWRRGPEDPAAGPSVAQEVG